jgi:hypothetical protein
MILSTLGDDLTTELPTSLSLLLDKLRNEITRIFAVKAISRIATSKLNVDISPILSDVIKELSSFLRKVGVVVAFVELGVGIWFNVVRVSCFVLNSLYVLIFVAEQQTVEAILIAGDGRCGEEVWLQQGRKGPLPQCSYRSCPSHQVSLSYFSLSSLVLHNFWYS